MPSCALMYLPNGRRQLLRRRRRILRNRNAAERRQHFGEDGAIERNAGDRKAGRDRRMRVNDGLHVWPLTVDLEVHQHFRRRVAIALQFSAFEIGDTHHVGRHESLADTLGRHQQPLGTQPNADVAVVRRRVTARVHPPADFNDVGAQRRFGGHAVRPSARSERRRSCPIRVATGDRAEVQQFAAHGQ